MSQILETYDTGLIRKKLDSSLDIKTAVTNVDELESLIEKLSEMHSAFVMEGYSIKGSIGEIDEIKKDVFKNSKKVIISFQTSHGKIENPQKRQSTIDKQSHILAQELRKAFGLPPIRSNPKPTVIRELKGMLKEYSNVHDNPVDAIKESRKS